MKKNILFIVILLLLTACTQTRYIEVPVETIKNNYINTIQKDTLIIRDSIDRWLKGDTVWVTKYKYIYKTQYIHDTIIKSDTITNTIYIDKIVTINELKDYQKFLIYIGLFSICFIIFVLYKKFKL